MNEEIISVEEALKRGYTHLIVGYNHRENQQVVAPLRRSRNFLNCGVSVAKLERCRELMREKPEDPEPAGDIPLIALGGRG